MDDPRNEYLTEKEFDAYLESLGIELEDVNYEDDGSVFLFTGCTKSAPGSRLCRMWVKDESDT